MTCQETEGRLDDWVDGALSPADAAEVEAHLAACPACRGSERQLRQLLAHAAALPRSLTPPHDLWPTIGRRLERERAWSWTPSRWWSAAGLAAAATVLAALAAVLWGQRSPSRARTVEIPAVRSEALVAADEPLADPELAAAERDYEQAANALLEALQQRRPALKPETLATIEGNLEVIDRALAEVRLALAKDPDNPELSRMLVATHRKKVDVLRRVVKLSTAL
jgi:anti-sigma factor RsiW